MSLHGLIAICRRLKHEEDGPTATEYAVMLALIIIVVMAIVTAIGGQVNGMFQNMVTCFG